MGEESEATESEKIALRIRPSAAEQSLLAGPDTPITGDDTATAEARQFNSGLSERDVRREALESDHDRSEKFRNHFELAIIGMMWVVVTGFLILALVWAFNIGLPSKYRWLDKDQIHDLQGILTGGLLIGLIGDHVKRRMNLNQIGAGS